MTVQNRDFDAAQALLDLHENVKQEKSDETNKICGQKQKSSSGRHTADDDDETKFECWLLVNASLEKAGSNSMVDASTSSKEESERTAKLFWNCFISSEMPVVVVPSSSTCHGPANTSQESSNTECPEKLEETENSVKVKSLANMIVSKDNENSGKTVKSLADINVSKYNENSDKKVKSLANTNYSKDNENLDAKETDAADSSITKTSEPLNLSDVIDKNNEQNVVETKEIEIQTEPNFNPTVEFVKNAINILCEKIESLEAQFKNVNLSVQNSDLISFENVNNQLNEQLKNIDCNMTIDKNDIKETVEYSKNIQFDNSNDSVQNENNKYYDNVTINNNSSPKANDLVPIGDGHAAVPARLLKHINWNSYTSATRKLLTAVFSRRILATHSLTGKPSPAFPNKKAKKRLNPALVNDIVQTVAERCSVPENVVRTSITTKCADESKMLKTREMNKKKTHH